MMQQYIVLEGKPYPVDDRGMLEPIDGISIEEQNRLDILHGKVAPMFRDSLVRKREPKTEIRNRWYSNYPLHG